MADSNNNNNRDLLTNEGTKIFPGLIRENMIKKIELTLVAQWCSGSGSLDLCV